MPARRHAAPGRHVSPWRDKIPPKGSLEAEYRLCLYSSSFVRVGFEGCSSDWMESIRVCLLYMPKVLNPPLKGSSVWWQCMEVSNFCIMSKFLVDISNTSGTLAKSKRILIYIFRNSTIMKEVWWGFLYSSVPNRPMFVRFSIKLG